MNAIHSVSGGFSVENAKLTLIVSRFNEFITSKLLEGCLDGLIRHGVKEDRLSVIRVPGAFELPLVAQRVARKGGIEAIIALGAVIRGATPHFDFVAAESAKGLAAVSLEEGLPVINGILTTDTIEQAIERAGTKSGNKGWDAAMNALEMIDLLRKIDG